MDMSVRVGAAAEPQPVPVQPQVPPQRTAGPQPVLAEQAAARDSAEAAEAAPAAGPGEDTAGGPAGAPAPPARKGQNRKKARKDTQAGPGDEDADEWAAVASIPAELSGWASAELPNQAHTGLAAWVAACSEPGERDSTSLPRSA